MHILKKRDIHSKHIKIRFFVPREVKSRTNFGTTLNQTKKINIRKRFPKKQLNLHRRQILHKQQPFGGFREKQESLRPK